MGTRANDPQSRWVSPEECVYAEALGRHPSRTPTNPLLRRAEQFFFEALFVNPTDCSALNGLGSILILERELQAAEFFVRRAIAKKKKLSDSDTEHDLAMITYYKKQA